MSKPNESKDISMNFATTLLKAMYGLDAPIGEISKVCDQLPNGELKQQLILAIGDILGVISNELMLPIYKQHPSLGSVSEPDI